MRYTVSSLFTGCEIFKLRKLTDSKISLYPRNKKTECRNKRTKKETSQNEKFEKHSMFVKAVQKVPAAGHDGNDSCNCKRYVLTFGWKSSGGLVDRKTGGSRND